MTRFGVDSKERPACPCGLVQGVEAAASAWRGRWAQTGSWVASPIETSTRTGSFAIFPDKRATSMLETAGRSRRRTSATAVWGWRSRWKIFSATRALRTDVKAPSRLERALVGARDRDLQAGDGRRLQKTDARSLLREGPGARSGALNRPPAIQPNGLLRHRSQLAEGRSRYLQTAGPGAHPAQVRADQEGDSGGHVPGRRAQGKLPRRRSLHGRHPRLGESLYFEVWDEPKFEASL
jgi:hypothetical protein